MESWIKFRLWYDNSFAPAMGNQHHGIDPNMLNSGHHDCSSQAVSARLTNCNGDHHHHQQQQHQHAQPSPPFIQHSLSNSFSCSIKFFLGLALGASCVASTTTEKHWCPLSTFSYCRGKAFPRQTCNNHLRRKQGCVIPRNLQQNPIKASESDSSSNLLRGPLLSSHSTFYGVMDQIQTVVWQFFCAGLGRSLCHGNQHHGIDPNVSNSGHHNCSTQAVFLCTAVKLQSCHMLAHWTQHTGPSHTTFIRAKDSVVLTSSFVRE